MIMTRLFDFMDWLLSFVLVAGAVMGIWICAVLIQEQNAVNEPDDVRKEWCAVKEAFKFNVRMIFDHLRKRKT